MKLTVLISVPLIDRCSFLSLQVKTLLILSLLFQMEGLAISLHLDEDYSEIYGYDQNQYPHFLSRKMEATNQSTNIPSILQKAPIDQLQSQEQDESDEQVPEIDSPTLVSADVRWRATNCGRAADENLKKDEKRSKYFFNRNVMFPEEKGGGKVVTFQKVIEDCSIRWGLVAAEIRHWDDYASLVRQYQKGANKPNVIPLSMRDDIFGTRGDWGYTNGERLTFSYWHHTFPDNDTTEFPEGQSCAVLKFLPLTDGTSSEVHWDDRACTEEAENNLQVCQFPKGHVCFENSDEEKAREDRDQGLFLVGVVEGRTYYSSYEQKNTFKDAFEFCKGSGYHLWEIPPVKTRAQFLEIHKELLTKLDVQLYARFWSSAYVHDPVTHHDWEWRRLSHNKTYNGHKADWAWWEYNSCNNCTRTFPTPQDKCLSWYIDELPSISSWIFQLRSFPCNQPFFVYCIADPALDADSGSKTDNTRLGADETDFTSNVSQSSSEIKKAESEESETTEPEDDKETSTTDPDLDTSTTEKVSILEMESGSGGNQDEVANELWQWSVIAV